MTTSSDFDKPEFEVKLFYKAVKNITVKADSREEAHKLAYNEFLDANPEEMLKEIQTEANRQDRSLSWIVQQAWRLSRGEIMRFPSVNDVLGTVEADDPKEQQL